MAPEDDIASIAVRSAKDEPAVSPPLHTTTETKNDVLFSEEPASTQRNPVGTRLGALFHSFERQLVEYNLEARGIERVALEDRMKRHSYMSYLQTFLLWVSINLAANNITLGMLGPAVYGLSFRDSALCAVFGTFVGGLVASWMATWGPISGIRTMVCAKYYL